ncbi:MAG TPA: hypothetical protein VKU01_17750 [Bryobacteraceae bacterium]|nr:hypothetical protein [Bryobacteraceae bacterium]
MKRLALLTIPAAMALVAQGPGPGRGHFAMGGGPRFDMMGMGMRQTVTGAPYSAVETVQEEQTLSGGNVIQHQNQSKVYRDSQGRVRIERTIQPPPDSANTTARTEVTIFDPVGGSFSVLNSQKMTAFKSNLPPQRNEANRPAHPADRHNPSGAQIVKENLGTQSIGGVTATGTRTTETIPAGAIGNQQAIQVVREVWLSSDLKVPVMIKTTDPRFGTRTMQLTSIVQSEPDASLFQVPSNYTVEAHTGGPRSAGHMRQNPNQNQNQ